MPYSLIHQYCDSMAASNASDLFLSVGRPPAFRIAGIIHTPEDAPILTEDDAQLFFLECLPPDTPMRLIQEKDVDLGVYIDGAGRFRINLSFQRGNTSMAIRRIPSGAIDPASLLIPDSVIHMGDESRGLILITGATSSGKSTSLAALLHYINSTYQKHIVTIEDPIEYAHEDLLSVVSQREVGGDTKDFATALKSVVRQNPDAIFIGEIRDMETIQTAISAALTGHLVAATMHTMDVQQTLERILNYYPEGLRTQAVHDLAAVLVGIVSQRLMPHATEARRIAAFEVLRVTPLARRLIAQEDFKAIPEIIKNGGDEGMISFNRCILNRYNDGLITLETALQTASNKEEFQLLLQGMETGIDTLKNYSGDLEHGISIKKLLQDMLHYGASDLILTAGCAPTIRLDGDLRAFSMPKLTPADTQKLVFSILNASQRADFEQNREIDFALAIKNLVVNGVSADFRFRVNGFYQKGAIAAAFRSIPMKIPSANDLGLPAVLFKLCQQKQGLILVTGPTGSGKSTTLAAMIDTINTTRPCHIITVEDPIEFVHTHKTAVIEQREVLADTRSFANALKYVLRQDPDVILVGEMRDTETISAVLTAAETGHLVFATLHTNDATQSVDRIIDVFPADRQSQVRTQLAASLTAIISQRLIRRADRPQGRIAAFEILIGNVAVKSMIRDRKTHQLKASMETASREGMITMERCLQNLVQDHIITPEDRDAILGPEARF